MQTRSFPLLPGRVWQGLAATTGVLGVAGVGLLWLAGSASALPSSVYLNQPRIGEGSRPAALQFGEPRSPSIKAVASVSGVSWSGWGEATATGTGDALVQWATEADTQEAAHVPVLVTAGGLRSCAGINIYTSLVMRLAAGAEAPPYFTQVERDQEVLPCEVHAGRYVAGKEERTDPQGCFFSGLSAKLLFRAVPPDRFGIFACGMRWKGWGTNRAIGVGVARKAEQQYGLRVVLSRPEWCPSWTVSYTQETAELWGNGERITGLGNVSRSDETRLDSVIGRHGQPHWTAHDAMPVGARCVG
jgi:hypothetical protein